MTTRSCYQKNAPTLLLLCCLLWTVSAKSQDAQINKITRQLHQTTVDTQRVNLLYKLGKAYKTNYARSQQYFQKGIDLSQQNGYTQGIVNGWLGLGKISQQTHRTNQALMYYDKAQKLAHQLKLYVAEVQSLHSLAKIYKLKNNFVKSICFYQKARNISQNKQNQYLLSKSLLYIGEFYRTQKNYRKSNKYLNNAETIAKQGKFLYLHRKILAFKSTLHYNQGQYQQMKVCDMKGLKIALKNGDSLEIAKAYNNLGGTFTILKNTNQALFYYKKALKLCRKYPTSLLLTSLYNNLGALHRKNKAYDLAINYYQRVLALLKDKVAYGVTLKAIAYTYYQKQDYTTAEQYFKKSMDTLSKLQALPQLSITCKRLAQNYVAQKNFKQAYHYRQLHQKLSDSLFSASKNELITLVEQEVSEEEKQKMIASLKQEAMQQKRLRTPILLGLLSVGIILVLVFRRYLLRHQLLQKKSSSLAKEIAQQKAEKQRLTTDKKAKQEENKQLKLHLDHKTRELATTSLLMHQKNEVLNHINEDLSAFGNQIPQKWSKNISHIQKIIRENTTLEKDWDRLQLHFNEVHPDFFNKLQEQFCHLTQNDLRLCAYIRVNLSNKDIARLLNVEFRSIQMAKYRLKKKLALPKTQDLNDFILKL